MKALFSVLLLVSLLFLPSCISSSGSNNLAPSNIGGISYSVIVRSGTGNLADSGTAMVTFSQNSTYTIDGDDVNVVDSKGVYTYKRISSNTGKALLVEASSGNTFVYRALYKDASSGTFTLIVEINGDQQSGDFTTL